MTGAISRDGTDWSVALTIYGVVALTFMMTMYALEHRHSRYVLGFALGCALSSTYGFLSGAWPFGVVEAIWTLIALRRFRGERS
jgi:hypothetical protein